jgi:Hypothetical protein (DUF2513)
MRRDLDLSRSILLFIEEHCPPEGGLNTRLEFEDYDRATVLAHVELLIEGGLVDGKMVIPVSGPIDVRIRKLTNHGHDAIKAIQDDSLWSKVKTRASEKGITLTFDLAVTLAKNLAKQILLG